MAVNHVALLEASHINRCIRLPSPWNKNKDRRMEWEACRIWPDNKNSLNLLPRVTCAEVRRGMTRDV